MKAWVPGAGLKVLALFLAFVVWFVVSAPRRESVSERTLPHNLEAERSVFLPA